MIKVVLTGFLVAKTKATVATWHARSAQYYLLFVKFSLNSGFDGKDHLYFGK